MERNRIVFRLFYGLMALIFLALNQAAYAVVIAPDTIISTPTTYSNTTVDLNTGNFIVREGASLTIENCTITGTLSASNANLISVERGTLNLTNNNVSINATAITPTPKTEASFYAIRLGRSSANISDNKFMVDEPFRAGLLTTSLILPSKNITVHNNTFQNFHGVLYLINAFNSTVTNNTFKFNSSGNIVLLSDKATIANNGLYVSGLNSLGNAMDIIHSQNTNIYKNVIFMPTSQGIAVTLSHDVLIDSNTITGGITYAINLLSSEEILKHPSPYIARIIAALNKNKMKYQITQNITITNNFMSQNRYGIAATNADNVTVTGNFFSQRFEDAASRKFWTDNSVLFQNVTNLTWMNNLYKEAFTQVNGGDNSLTDQIVPFPATGGVVL